MAGWGWPRPELPSAWPWLQASREQHASKEQACLTCSSRLRGPEQAAVPSWSTGHPRAQGPAVEGRQQGKDGWHSSGSG